MLVFDILEVVAYRGASVPLTFKQNILIQLLEETKIVEVLQKLLFTENNTLPLSARESVAITLCCCLGHTDIGEAEMTELLSILIRSLKAAHTISDRLLQALCVIRILKAFILLTRSDGLLLSNFTSISIHCFLLPFPFVTL